VSQPSLNRRPPQGGRPDTLATHAGDDPYLFLGAASPAIVQTSTFVFESFDAFADALAHPDQHYFYTRGNNPTTVVTEQKIAALEGAESCRLFGSGMAAIAAAVLSQVRAGDHVLSINTVYGPTRRLLSDYLVRYGIETTYVDGTDPAQFEAAIRSNTRLFYLESPSSNLMLIQDLRALSAMAKRHSIRTIIDNSYCSMMLQRPLDLGIDLVVYSVTKFLNGHSDVVAGAVLGSWELMQPIFRNEHPVLGGIIGPFEAWLVGRGLRTLPARMRQHQASATQVVDYLFSHPKIRRIHYPGHPSHSQYELAQSQMKGGSSLLSLELDSDDIETTKRFVNALQYFAMGVSWGGFESLSVPYAAGQVHRLPKEKWTQVNQVRLHVGLEDPLDLIEDLEQSLAGL